MPLLNTVNRHLHQNFVQWGFHPHPDANAYFGMVAVPNSTHEQEVHVVLADDTKTLSLTSVVEPSGVADVITIGAAEECLRDDAVVGVDGGVNVWSTPLSLHTAERDFQHVLKKAITIAQQAHQANEKTCEHRARFHELCTLVGRRFDAAANMDQFELRELIGWLKEMLDLNPNRELWAFLLGGAGKNAVRFWSLGTGEMQEEPWDRTAEFLTRYGTQRGWVMG